MIQVYSRKRKKNPRIGLALGGGGAKGLAHIAFLKVFDSLGIKPSIICGTSIGALVGGLYASGHNGLGIERIFRDLDFKDAISLVDLNFQSIKGLLKGKNIQKFYKKLVEKKQFKDLNIPLKVVATDYWARKQIIFDQGDLSEAIRASISLPGIFEPMKLNESIYIDGGMMNSLPYDVIRKDCDLLIAIDVLGENQPKNIKMEKPKIFEALMSSFQIMEAAQNENKMKSIKPDIYIKPALKNVDIQDFRKIDEILKSVSKDAAEFKKLMALY